MAEQKPTILGQQLVRTMGAQFGERLRNNNTYAELERIKERLRIIEEKLELEDKTDGILPGG